MKTYIIKLAVLLVLPFFFACKNSESNGTSQDGSKSEVVNQGENLEQEAIVLANSEGEEITMVLFAKDGEIAINLKFEDGVKEFLPLGVIENGNPVFSDGERYFELFSDGKSGALTDADKTTVNNYFPKK